MDMWRIQEYIFIASEHSQIERQRDRETERGTGQSRRKEGGKGRRKERK